MSRMMQIFSIFFSGIRGGKVFRWHKGSTSCTGSKFGFFICQRPSRNTTSPSPRSSYSWTTSWTATCSLSLGNVLIFHHICHHMNPDLLEKEVGGVAGQINRPKWLNWIAIQLSSHHPLPPLMTGRSRESWASRPCWRWGRSRGRGRETWGPFGPSPSSHPACSGEHIWNENVSFLTFGFFCFFLLPWSWSAWLPLGGPRLCRAIC